LYARALKFSSPYSASFPKATFIPHDNHPSQLRLPSGTSYPVAAFDLTIAASIAKLLASHPVIQAIISAIAPPCRAP